MKVAALIPARAGSKRLTNKNWAEVAGKPLWLLAVEHAKQSGAIDRIAISTDDEHILLAAKADLAIPRPLSLARDDTVMLAVVRHADAAMAAAGWDHDAICILQPTSPLRSPADVAACVDMMGKGVESVVSVTEAADDVAFVVRHAQRLERLPPIVVPNGAVYVLSTEALRAGRDWYGPYAYAYRMPKERSIDVDTEVDLRLARLLADADACI